MSLAIRKRSWEEHVTQWMGLPFGSVDSNILCRHGLVADNVQASMETDEVQSCGQKETSASLPDCCHGGELAGFPLKLLGNVSKEVDENDNHQEEEDLFSLEDSTETLVGVSFGGDGGGGGVGELSLDKASDHLVQVGEELSDVRNDVGSAESFLKTEPRVEANEETDYACAPTRKGNELYCDCNSRGNCLKENLCQSQEKIVSGEKTVHAAVAEHQHRKLVIPKEGCEKTPCSPAHDAPSPGQCHGKYNQAAVAADSGDYPLPVPCSPLLSEDHDLDCFADSQDKLLPGAPLVEGGSDLKNSMATQEATDSQIILRKRKEAREGRDQSRLDSMVLLILKLDQLDQDIENALSSGSSPPGTPTHLRRHIHDLESHPDGGVDMATVSQPQTNVPRPSDSYGADHSFPIPMAGSGAKPKVGAMPVITEKEKAEIEAKEACDWLRAAGFPQYAQLYEDLIFPVDITSVKREHDFLDRDAIEALCRRLNTLNKCAAMKLEISPHRKRSEDSDEDEPCAISGKWTFQRDSKRWSRLEEFNVFPPKQDPNATSPEEAHLSSAASHESVLTDLSEHQEIVSVHSISSNGSHPTASHSEAATTRTNSVISIGSSGNLVANEDSFSSLPSPKDLSNFSFGVKTNEKNAKSKTRSLLKRMESLKIKSSHHAKNKAPSKLGLIISGPILQQGVDEEKLKQLNCVEISTLNGNHINVPMVRKRSVSNSTQTSSSSSQSETSSAVSTPSPITRTRSLSAYNKRVGMYLEGFDPFNQSTFNDVIEQNFRNRGSFAEDTVFFIPEDHKPGTFPKALSNGSFSPSESSTSVNWRTGSFHGRSHLTLRRENSSDSSKELSMGKRRNSSSSMCSRLSIYDNVPGSFLYSSSGDLANLENEDLFPELDDILYHVKGMQKIVNQWSEKFSDEGDSDSALDSVSPCPSSPKQILFDVDNDRTIPSDLDSTGNSLNDTEESTGIQERRDSGVGASLTRPNRHRMRWHSFQSSHRPSLSSASLQINCQSVVQMNLLQKYSLLKLTALLEKYTPSNKHGFNW